MEFCKRLDVKFIYTVYFFLIPVLLLDLNNGVFFTGSTNNIKLFSHIKHIVFVIIICQDSGGSPSHFF